MPSSVGRLWVAVDADIRPAMTALKHLDAQALATSHRLRTMGGSGSSDPTAGLRRGMSQTAKAADEAARATHRIGNAARAAGSPMKNLQAATYRTSQAFINMRYGNPIGVLSGLSSAASSLRAALMGATGAAGGLAAGIVAIAVAAPVVGVALTAVGAAIAKSGIEGAAELEQLTISFEGMLGSAERAAQEVAFLQGLSTTSIVPTDQIMEADRQLLAFGVTADGLRQNLVKFMADYGSAVNLSTGQIQGLSYVIGQINAQGKAYAQDIKQLANASVGVDKLSKALGMSTGEFSKFVASGKATAAVLLPAILKVGEGAGATAKKMNESAQGMISNIKDVAKVKMTNAFGGLLSSLKPLIVWVKKFIDAFDFSYIAKAWENVVGYFKQTFAGTSADAEDMATSMAETIGKAINIVGFTAAWVFNVFRAIFNTWMTIINGVWTAIQWLVGRIITFFADLIDKVSWIPGPIGDAAEKASASLRGMGDAAAEGAGIAGNAFVNSAKAAGEAWGGVFTNIAMFKDIGKTKAKGAGIAPVAPLPLEPFGGTETEDEKSAKAKQKKIKKQWDDWLKFMRELLNDFKAALKEMQGLTRQFTGGELSKIQEAFRFGGKENDFKGDVNGIISMFDNLNEAVTKYYRIFASPRASGKAAAKKAATERDAMLADLRGNAEKLVKMARENEKLAKDLDAWREEEGKRVEAQITSLNNQYNGYNDARGYAVKGLIENAQSALDAATQAFEDANQKLQDLISARDEYLTGIRDSARGFVNALDLADETIARYTRLDAAGSFLVEEEKKTANFKDQMAKRLETMRSWAANVKALIAKGLNSDLLKELVAAGPESAGAVVQQLVDGTQSSIDEINGMQSELSTVVGSLQATASQQWFDAGINQQQSAVNSLAAAKAAAEQALADIQAQYNVKLAALEAYQKQVEDGTDAHSVTLTALMAANDTAAASIADAIQKKFEWLTDEKNPKNMAVLGKNGIEGMIKGLEAMEPLVIATAKRIADKVAQTMRDALQVKSPSRVMQEIGEFAGEGLAIGMESSLSKVEAASMLMSRASLPNINNVGSSSNTSPTEVRVFIGDKELRDIVDVQILNSDSQSLDYVASGRRI